MEKRIIAELSLTTCEAVAAAAQAPPPGLLRVFSLRRLTPVKAEGSVKEDKRDLNSFYDVFGFILKGSG